MNIGMTHARTLAHGLAAVLLALAAQGAAAQPTDCAPDRAGIQRCGPTGSVCLRDGQGNVKCSPARGGIALDGKRAAMCGVGACAATSKGEVICSTVAEGSVAINTADLAICTEGCAPGDAALCQAPRS